MAWEREEDGAGRFGGEKRRRPGGVEEGNTWGREDQVSSAARWLGARNRERGPGTFLFWIGGTENYYFGRAARER